MITPVILSGGSGTRLWPLSRKDFPKQFVPLINNKSLFEHTLTRLTDAGFNTDQIITVAAEQHRFLVAEAMDHAGVKGIVILEQTPRNTAAAMALAAQLTAQYTSRLAEHQHQPSDLLLFCPADHHIPDAKSFVRTVHEGAEQARAGAIVTFGITPSYPATAYGYIEQGEQLAGLARKVNRFIEKPAEGLAKSLVLSGDNLWNSGIFLVRADEILSALELHAPEILSRCVSAMASAESEAISSAIEFIRPAAKPLDACPASSIDYAVMQSHDNSVVVPFEGQWSDVGSWDTLAALTEPDENENRIKGQGQAHHSSATYIHAPERPVIALGTNDLLIIDTADAVLVASRQYAEQVRAIVKELERNNIPEAVAHRKVARPWGWYDTVNKGENYRVKHIGVKPGASLSLQKHEHRTEHWIVVKGTAEVTRGDDVFTLAENQSIYIPKGEIHRLKNPGTSELEMIEVQSGEYLGEDDIIRLDDKYGRSSVN